MKVIGDCLNLLCERLNVVNTIENDEYSIFMINAVGELLIVLKFR